MNPVINTWVRLGATAVVTTLTALYAYYPQWHWVPAVLLAASVLGIHAIPAIGQTQVKLSIPPTPTPGNSEPFTGA